MTQSWSAYIIALTVLTIVGAAWLLFANRTRPAGTEEKTGHVYDGIEEYDNPLPAWWLYLFVATLVFTAGYLVAYPGLGNFAGVLGWTQISQLQRDVDMATARYEPVFAAFRDMPIEQMARDPQANRMGQRLFAVNCAQCHGADARGSRGYPNLTDKDWIWGGTPEAIVATITNGRQAAMPAFGPIVGEEGATNVARYVLTLSGGTADAASAAGETTFKTICAACHGIDGSGNPALGAPRLNDDIWLYGGELEQIRLAALNGHNGQMPVFGNKLDADRIRLLAAFVYGLSQ